ncbi:MAG: exonuclease domain-containing protein, partial [Candidatus Dormibacteraeota bacterium]|nr:exonuclease domain-containing protein [Candidatus Dormibacteraeota bacterium]
AATTQIWIGSEPSWPASSRQHLEPALRVSTRTLMQYAAFDLETTGLDPAQDQVIEIGAVSFDADGLQEHYEELVRPVRQVPSEVLALTGIEPAALALGSEPALALDRLRGFLAGRIPVAHGGGFDLSFLRQNGAWPDEQEVLDTLDLARILLPGVASHSLPRLAADLGLDQPRPHRALDDADATRQLLVKLRDRARALPPAVKSALLDICQPHSWPLAKFLAEALAAPALPDQPGTEPTVKDLPAQPAPTEQGPKPPEDPAALAALLSPDGPLAAQLEGYEPREAQVQMLLAVAQTMQRGSTLVVEAGTGTGKSLAYLIPAAARAVLRRERVVIATHTHSLQEQLVGRDIPALQSWLPWSFSARQLKGRSSYISLRRWRRYLSEPCYDQAELAFRLKVSVWLATTASGEGTEVKLQEGEHLLWARVASDRFDCRGWRCTAAANGLSRNPSDCFVHRARAQAEAADLVIVNHALLVADASLQGQVVPEYDHLVVDEAHHLEEAATEEGSQTLAAGVLTALLGRLASGSESSPGLLAELARQPRLGDGGAEFEAAGPVALQTRHRLEQLWPALLEWSRRRDEGHAQREAKLRLTDNVRAEPGFQQLAGLAEDAATALFGLDAELRRCLSLSLDGIGGERRDAGLRELESIRDEVRTAATLVQAAFLGGSPETVKWLTLFDARGPTIHSVPLDVAGVLADNLFADRASVVLTSASLAVAGSFDYFLARCGVSAAAETLLLASPFDYIEQSLVCLAADMPEPQEPAFDVAVVDLVAALAARLGGRTLALFTSHTHLRDAYAALKQRRDLDQVLIVGQGLDGSRRQVLQAFEGSERALLLGTASFWEGIDVPGDRLSCVVIVRLPFPVPTDPLYAARAERLRDPFLQAALPLTALRLKQGFGRLIRRRADRGAAVILDSRVVTREYGRALLAALPPAERFIGPAAQVGERVEAWLSRSAASP